MQVYKKDRGVSWEWKLGKSDRPKNLPDWYRPCFEQISGAQPSVIFKGGAFHNVKYKEWDSFTSEISAGGYLIEDKNYGIRGVLSNNSCKGASSVDMMTGDRDSDNGF